MMKKYLISLFILFSVQSQAQKHSWEYGLQTGININSANGSGINKQYKSTRIGFGLGAHIQYNFSQHFGIVVKPQYDQNGYSYKSLTFITIGNTLSTGNVFYKLNYINLPVMAVFTSGNKIKFTSAAGIFFGALVSDHFTTTITGPPASTTTSKSNSSKSFNFGFAAATGIQIPIVSKLKLDIGVQDNFGVANILKTISPSDNKIHTNALSVIMGVTWKM